MLTMNEIEVLWERAPRSPQQDGSVELLCVREIGAHRVVDHAQLTPEAGVVGARWSAARSPNPEMQVTLMNIHVVRLLASDHAQLHAAGDNVLVDLDLSEGSLLAGARIRIGDAELEISRAPHTGCGKFSSRFGADALAWVNAPKHASLRLSGVNCRILKAGAVRVGDRVTIL